MKKLFVLLLCLSLCLPCAFSLAEEAGEAEREILTCGDFEYALLEDGTAEITRYRGKAGSLEVPDELDGHVVTAIGDDSFSYLSHPATVTLLNTVTTIGNSAFVGSILTSISIPDSVTAIGKSPFALCDKLSKIVVSPDHPTLATIDGVLFSKPDRKLICYPLAFTQSEYTVPQGIEIIGDWAFSGCRSLTSIYLSDSVTVIDRYAFNSCPHLTSVFLSDNVTIIGERAFSECSRLTAVTIPDSIVSIGDGAFSFCKSLTEIIVGRDSYARQYCIDHNLPYTYADANDWLNG